MGQVDIDIHIDVGLLCVDAKVKDLKIGPARLGREISAALLAGQPYFSSPRWVILLRSLWCGGASRAWHGMVTGSQDGREERREGVPRIRVPMRIFLCPHRPPPPAHRSHARPMRLHGLVPEYLPLPLPRMLQVSILLSPSQAAGAWPAGRCLQPIRCAHSLGLGGRHVGCDLNTPVVAEWS